MNVIEMDEPSSPEPDPGYSPEPRITNRAQGGIRSDKTRFIRPVERQRMRPWLIEHLDKNDIPGLDWQQREGNIFKISWKHAANQCFNLETDTNLFERWAIHTGRHQDSDHKRWKANFRCALNSLPDVEELKDQGVKKGNNAFKVYRFLGEEEVKTGKPRKKKEPGQYVRHIDSDIQEEDMVRYRQNSVRTLKREPDREADSAITGEVMGVSSVTDGAVSSIPHLQQLVPSGSGVDMLVDASSKDRNQPVANSMDNLQEILAAATASLEAGSDAQALEKISIEQLSRLGEVSKMTLDIRQSDRKRRKKELSGILNVFLCNWCEKVFPAKVDLFQHFLMVHQDKLLSGEEYGARQSFECSESLQEEIADLEKKVLGFTQETFPVKDSEEVIEDGQVVDMSSNNSMTSQEVYIEDQALDLSVAGALARHPVGTSGSSSIPHPEIVALDLSMSSQEKQKPGQKNGSGTGKPVVKRRRSQAMDMDYTVKFTNYGLAGAPRTKRQLSLLMKKKEEEEEKQRKQAEAQHSVEDFVHAEILMSLKSASKEDGESESMEVEEGADNVIIIQQGEEIEAGKEKKETENPFEKVNDEKAQAESDNVENVNTSAVKVVKQEEKVPGQDSGEPEVKKIKIDETQVKKTEIVKADEKEIIQSTGQSKPSDGATVSTELPVATTKCVSEMVVKAYKCGICSDGFEDPAALLEHVSKHRTEFRCYVCSMVMHDKDEYLHHLEGHLPKMQYEKTCNTCGEVFSTLEEFAKHEKTHVETVKGYLCKYCTKVYLRKEACIECERQHELSETKSNNRTESEKPTGQQQTESTKVDETGDATPLEAEDEAKSFIESLSGKTEEKTEIQSLMTGQNYSETGQKNLQGEPAGVPAAGSDICTGPEILEASHNNTAKSDSRTDRCNSGLKSMVDVDCTSGQKCFEVAKGNNEEAKFGEEQFAKSSENTLKTTSRDSEKNNDSSVSHWSVVFTKKEKDVAAEKTEKKGIETLKQKKSECSTPVLKEQLESGSNFVFKLITQQEKLAVKCGYCDKRLNITDISTHLNSHQNFAEVNKRRLGATFQYVCIICSKPIPAKLYDKHIRSHSVFDLSRSEMVKNIKPQTNIPALLPVAELAKNILVCNLCYSAFDSFTELKSHVYSHLGSKAIKKTLASHIGIKEKQGEFSEKTGMDTGEKDIKDVGTGEPVAKKAKGVVEENKDQSGSKQPVCKTEQPDYKDLDKKPKKIQGNKKRGTPGGRSQVDGGKASSRKSTSVASVLASSRQSVSFVNRRTSPRATSVMWMKEAASTVSPYRFNRKYTARRPSASEQSFKHSVTDIASEKVNTFEKNDKEAVNTNGQDTSAEVKVEPVRVVPEAHLKTMRSGGIISTKKSSVLSEVESVSDKRMCASQVSTSITESLAATSLKGDSVTSVLPASLAQHLPSKILAELSGSDVTSLGTAVQKTSDALSKTHTPVTFATKNLGSHFLKALSPTVSLQRMKIPLSAIKQEDVSFTTASLPIVVLAPSKSVTSKTSSPVVVLAPSKSSTSKAAISTASKTVCSSVGTMSLSSVSTSTPLVSLSKPLNKIKLMPPGTMPTRVMAVPNVKVQPVVGTTFPSGISNLKVINKVTVQVPVTSAKASSSPACSVRPGQNTVKHSTDVLPMVKVVPKSSVNSTVPQVMYASQQTESAQPQSQKSSEYKLMWLPSSQTANILHSFANPNQPRILQVLPTFHPQPVLSSTPPNLLPKKPSTLVYSIPASELPSTVTPSVVNLQGTAYTLLPQVSVVPQHLHASSVGKISSASSLVKPDHKSVVGEKSTQTISSHMYGASQPVTNSQKHQADSALGPIYQLLTDNVVNVQSTIQTHGPHTNIPGTGQPVQFIKLPIMSTAALSRSSQQVVFSPGSEQSLVRKGDDAQALLHKLAVSSGASGGPVLSSQTDKLPGITPAKLVLKCSFCQASIDSLNDFSKHNCKLLKAHQEAAKVPLVSTQTSSTVNEDSIDSLDFINYETSDSSEFTTDAFLKTNESSYSPVELQGDTQQSLCETGVQRSEASDVNLNAVEDPDNRIRQDGCNTIGCGVTEQPSGIEAMHGQSSMLSVTVSSAQETVRDVGSTVKSETKAANESFQTKVNETHDCQSKSVKETKTSGEDDVQVSDLQEFKSSSNTSDERNIINRSPLETTSDHTEFGCVQDRKAAINDTIGGQEETKRETSHSVLEPELNNETIGSFLSDKRSELNSEKHESDIDKQVERTTIVTLYPCAICQQAFTLETILEHSRTHLNTESGAADVSTSLPLDSENSDAPLLDTSCIL